MNKIDISLSINGKDKQFSAYPMDRLLDVIRTDSELTGTKEGCGEGECGACTVLLNGRPVCACLVPVFQAAEANILTVEGMADDRRLDPIQQAFIDEGAIQCGYCMPAMIITAKSLLNKNPTPSTEEIRHAMGSNLCRCSGYVKVIDAVK